MISNEPALRQNVAVRPHEGAAAIADAERLPEAVASLPVEIERIWSFGMDRVERGGADLCVLDIPSYLAAQAREAEAALAAALRPGTREQLWAWLKALQKLRACREAPTDNAKELVQIVAGLWAVCEGLPAGCWTTETLKAWMRETIYWPLPASLYKFMLGVQAELKRRQHACRAIVAAAGRPPEAAVAEKERDPAAVERVSAVVAGFVGHNRMPRPLAARFAREQTEPPASRPVAPRPDDATLLAHLDAEIRQRGEAASGALRFRADMLRRKLAADSAAQAPHQAAPAA